MSFLFISDVCARIGSSISAERSTFDKHNTDSTVFKLSARYLELGSMNVLETARTGPDQSEPGIEKPRVRN